MADTHFGSLANKRRVLAPDLAGNPVDPQVGDMFFDNLNNRWAIYYSSQWYYLALTTSTSTSSSTTTTSTSTTTTSTSTSTTTSTSTSTTTSTTTTL